MMKPMMLGVNRREGHSGTVCIFQRFARISIFHNASKKDISPKFDELLLAFSIFGAVCLHLLNMYPIAQFSIIVLDILQNSLFCF